MASVANLSTQFNQLETQTSQFTNGLPAGLKQDLYNVRADLDNLLKNPNDANNGDMKAELSHDLSKLSTDYNNYAKSNPNNLQQKR